MENQDTKLDKLAAALVAFQSEVPVIEKNRSAKIKTKSGSEYSYKYADLADIWAAIREPLAKNKLAVTQELVGGSDGHTGLTATIWHESGQTKASTLDIPTADKSAQEFGSQITYYKRYALGAALGISTEEDDDGVAGNTPPQTAPKASPHKPASEKQLGLIRSLAEDLNYDGDWIDATLQKVKSSADASIVIEKLKEKQS